MNKPVDWRQKKPSRTEHIVIAVLTMAWGGLMGYLLSQDVSWWLWFLVPTALMMIVTVMVVYLLRRIT